VPQAEVRASDVAARLGGELRGPDIAVSGLAAVEDATPGAVVVAGDAATLAAALAAGPAVVVAPASLTLTPEPGCAVIVVPDARLALARLTTLFDRRPQPEAGIHPTAAVASSAILGEGVSVGAYSVIDAGAEIGEGSVLGPHCSIGAGARLGRDCRLFAGVRVYDGVIVGDRVRLHGGCVLGADGFGYAAGPAGAEKIHHLAGVVVGDDVEIGANTAVDRGTLRPTRIGARTKIDNLCQIGHNVSIGEDCLIAAMSGVAGSATLHRGVVLGGYVAVADHVTLHAGARVAGRSGITKDVPAGETWAGFPAVPYRRWVRGLYLQGQLERLWRAFKGRDEEP